jgi:hypothetical protein
MDLFTPVVDSSMFHPAFANVKALDNQYDEAVLKQWADGFIDRDGKFVTEFQTTFDSSFWELYLHAVLKYLACRIDLSYERPDFWVTDPIPFCLEATVALHAAGAESAAVAPVHAISIDISELNRQAIIRLANSISSKSRKYIRDYSGLAQVRDRPFVIAVAPFDRPGFTLQINRAIEAYLFGYYVDESHGSIQELIATGPEISQINEVRKDSGASVKVGIFNDDSHSHISAILFSTCATWGKVSALSADPYSQIIFDTLHYNPFGCVPTYSRHLKVNHEEHLIDGLRVYHNPYAEHPLPIDLFSDERIFQTWFDHSQGEWQYQISSKNLMFRSSLRFVPNPREDQ